MFMTKIVFVAEDTIRQWINYYVNYLVLYLTLVSAIFDAIMLRNESVIKYGKSHLDNGKLCCHSANVKTGCWLLSTYGTYV